MLPHNDFGLWEADIAAHYITPISNAEGTLLHTMQCNKNVHSNPKRDVNGKVVGIPDPNSESSVINAYS